MICLAMLKHFLLASACLVGVALIDTADIIEAAWTEPTWDTKVSHVLVDRLALNSAVREWRRMFDMVFVHDVEPTDLYDEPLIFTLNELHKILDESGDLFKARLRSVEKNHVAVFWPKLRNAKSLSRIELEQMVSAHNNWKSNKAMRLKRIHKVPQNTPIDSYLAELLQKAVSSDDKSNGKA